tara:strand:+ start:77 stop:475 length:399 start_codon:yes stop_codon:yes gene_type:complete
MANSPFRLKSQGSSFKMMGSSPVKNKYVPKTNLSNTTKKGELGDLTKHVEKKKLKAKKLTKKTNERGETLKEEKKRIIQDKKVDKLIRDSNYEDFVDKQKKDNKRQIKREKTQEHKNKQREKYISPEYWEKE